MTINVIDDPVNDDSDDVVVTKIELAIIDPLLNGEAQLLIDYC